MKFIFLTIYYKTLFLGDTGQKRDCIMKRGGLKMKIRKYYRTAGVDIWEKRKSWKRGWIVCPGG